MSNSTRTNPTSIRGARRKAAFAGGHIVELRPLRDDRPMPLLAVPVVHGVDLVAWARNNKDLVLAELRHSGAIVFEGFGCSVADFEEFIKVFSPEVLEDPMRYDLGGPRSRIYRSTAFPAAYDIFLHNETWWQFEWPRKLFFYCAVAPEKGGATSIADCRRVLARLPDTVVDRFSKGVLMVKNYGHAVLLRRWQDVFGTTRRSEVEAFCRRYELEYTWLCNDRLQTRHLRPVLLRHPDTEDLLWFNHVAHGHVSASMTSADAGGLSRMRHDEIPTNTFYADGRDIEVETLTTIREAYLDETVNHPWCAGSIMLVDNLSVAHGRTSYQGDREILVAMAERMGW